MSNENEGSRGGIAIHKKRVTGEIDYDSRADYFDIDSESKIQGETVALHGENKADISAARELIALNEEVKKARKNHKKIRPDALIRITEIEEETGRLKILLEEKGEAKSRGRASNQYIQPLSDLAEPEFLLDAEEDPDDILISTPADTSNKIRSNSTIRLIIAGTTAVLAGSALCTGIISEIRELIKENDMPIKELTTDVISVESLSNIKAPEPTVQTPPSTRDTLAAATTLYGRVIAEIESKPESANLSESAKIRLSASTTNDLALSVHADAHTWSDSPEAYKDLKGKLNTWTGWDAVLDSATAGHVENISDLVAHVKSDTNLSPATGKLLESTIQLIDDPIINPDQKAVQAKHASVTTEQVNQVVAEKLAHPPETPKAYTYPKTESSSASLEYDQIDDVELLLDEELMQNSYDAPEFRAIFAERQSTEPITVSAVWEEENEMEDLGDELVEIKVPTIGNAFDAIEPGNLFGATKEISIPKIGNPFDTVEPANIVKAEALVASEPAKPEQVIYQPKTFMENASSAVSSLFGAAKKWFS